MRCVAVLALIATLVATIGVAYASPLDSSLQKRAPATNVVCVRRTKAAPMDWEIQPLVYLRQEGRWQDAEGLFNGFFTQDMVLQASWKAQATFIWEIRTIQGTIFRYWLTVNKGQSVDSLCHLNPALFPSHMIATVNVYMPPGTLGR